MVLVGFSNVGAEKAAWWKMSPKGVKLVSATSFWPATGPKTGNGSGNGQLAEGKYRGVATVSAGL